ncbi:EF-hand domain-containing protein [Motilimonas sp. KMU-193]|uniref:EF-hand domain-containing protein n=1 Tax=Motilimonas sp. KMU-193 TaxID=3388668 RepID=UPI00396AF6ED
MKLSWLNVLGLVTLLLAGSALAAQKMGWQQDNCGRMSGVGAGNQPSFAELDLNQNQVVTQAEFAEFRQIRQANRPGKGRNGQRVDDETMFLWLDQDENGEVSEAEFLAHQEACRGNW